MRRKSRVPKVGRILLAGYSIFAGFATLAAADSLDSLRHRVDVATAALKAHPSKVTEAALASAQELYAAAIGGEESLLLLPETAPTPQPEAEPNGTSATANLVTMTGQYALVTGTINPGGDLDFFTLTGVPAGARIWVETDTGGTQGPGATSRDTVMDLLAADGSTVIENDDDDGTGNGADGTVETGLASMIGGRTLTAGGTYFLRVRAFSGTAIINPYALSIVLTTDAGTAEVESNNTAATANPIATAGSPIGIRTGAIGTAGDADYYSVVASVGDIVYFNVDADPERDGTGTDLVVEFRDPADVLLLSVDSSITGSVANPAAEGARYAITAAGTYFVRVRHFSASGTGTYHIMVAAGPAGSAYCSENFDGVTAPALPAGWTTSFVNGAANCTPTGTCALGTNWATSTTTPDTAPNDGFHNDPSCVTDSLLDSPVFNPTAGAQLTFRNSYNTESTFDGGVLEISINGGAYQDILTAGGSFAGGGYNGTISINFLSPIAGRQAWTGNSSGYVTTTVNLPPAAIGQPVTFRFRMASDCSVGSTGWRVDTIAMTPCGGGGGGCVITPPADITVSNDANQCGAVVNFPPPTTSGQCGPITCAPPSGSFFPVATTTVTCSDPTGANASFDVTVNDTQLPIVVAPDLVVGNDAGLCSAVVNYNATASDNCPGVGPVVCAPPSGTQFPVGVSPVNCTATDAAGNVGNDAGSIAVNDVEPPVITCPADIELDLPPGSTGQNVAYDPPTVSDNCGVVYDCQPPSGDVFPAGQTPVTCTAQDPASNTAQCGFLITLGALTVLEVPTVSSLGLLALALLLAAAAFVALRRNG